MAALELRRIETLNEGNFKFYKDTFNTYDNNCRINVCGKYKITFFTHDSASFILIADSSKDWANEVNGGSMKKIKK